MYWPSGGVLPLFPATNDTILDKILFNDDDIITHIRSLNPYKAHGCDGITIRMIQFCDDTLVIPLSIIYSKCIKKGVFLNFGRWLMLFLCIKKTVNS